MFNKASSRFQGVDDQPTEQRSAYGANLITQDIALGEIGEKMKFNLFEVIVDEDKLHPLFKQVLNDPAYAKTHPIINSWGIGLLARSGETTKFIKEFQTTFNSSFWELYLNKAFQDLGFDIDYSKPSPDFNLTGAGKRLISVEAVTSNPRAVEELTLNGPGYDFLNESTLKLAGKIRDKHKLYMGDGKKKNPYSSLEHVKGNPFVLAVAPFDSRFSQTQNNTAINRVLYGLEPPRNYHSLQSSVENISNQNGQDVGLGVFTNDSYKEISAVIFSTTGTFGKAVSQAGIANFIRATRLRKIPIAEFIEKEGLKKLGRSMNEISTDCIILSERFIDGLNVCGFDMCLYDASQHKESHLDGFQVYYNPYALHPLSDNDFNCPEVVYYRYNTKTNQMLIDYNDNALVSRNTVTSLA